VNAEIVARFRSINRSIVAAIEPLRRVRCAANSTALT
jgi:hypothetical protein